jgi:hypothetical protein
MKELDDIFKTEKFKKLPKDKRIFIRICMF